MADKAFFYKSLISTMAYGLPRQPKWIPVEDVNGIYETSDKAMIDALRAKAEKKVAGIREISQEEFESKKAEPRPQKRFVTLEPSLLRPRLGNRVGQGPFGQGSEKNAAAAGKPGEVAANTPVAAAPSKASISRPNPQIEPD